MRHRRHKGHRLTQRQFSPRLQRLLNEVSTESGYSAERQIHEMLTEKQRQKKLPPWLHGFCHHKPNSMKDRMGIDFTFFTDVGDIFVQVKSSWRGAQVFMSKRRRAYINVVIIDVRDPFEKTYAKLIARLERCRQKFMAPLTAHP